MTAIASHAGQNRVAGDGLLHPFALAASATLLLNDMLLKPAFGNWFTGKLSDVAALVVLAVVIQAVAELAGAPIRPRVLAAALVASGVALIAIKLLPPAGELYRWGLGAAQWVPGAAAALFDRNPMPDVIPVALTRDATDLVTLPILMVAWFLFRERVDFER